MKEFILVKNHMNAKLVSEALVKVMLFKPIREFTREKNHMSVKPVMKGSSKGVT